MNLSDQMQDEINRIADKQERDELRSKPDYPGEEIAEMRAEIERLTAENERLRWERDQYKENARRMSGLRDSENA